MSSLSAQSLFEQSVSVDSTGSDTCPDCALDIKSDSKVLKINSLSTIQRNDINSPIPGMLIYNQDSAKLQGYIPENILIEPDTTFLFGNMSDNLFASTVIIYTPTVDGYIDYMDIGLSSVSQPGQHRLIVDDSKPCGASNNITKPNNLKSNTMVYTDYIMPVAGTKNRYNLSTPYAVTAGTKYYIYPDAATNSPTQPRIYWSANSSTQIGSIFNTVQCGEVTSDLDVQFTLITDPAGWVNLND